MARRRRPAAEPRRTADHRRDRRRPAAAAHRFRVILDAEPDISVVGEAADGEAAVDVVRRRRPDVVLMDIRMPEVDGLSAAGGNLAIRTSPRPS